MTNQGGFHAGDRMKNGHSGVGFQFENFILEKAPDISTSEFRSKGEILYRRVKRLHLIIQCFLAEFLHWKNCSSFLHYNIWIILKFSVSTAVLPTFFQISRKICITVFIPWRAHFWPEKGALGLKRILNSRSAKSLEAFPNFQTTMNGNPRNCHLICLVGIRLNQSKI